MVKGLLGQEKRRLFHYLGGQNTTTKKALFLLNLGHHQKLLIS